jgi:N-acetylglutamate synthase-like GNAT family acetyltransferase
MRESNKVIYRDFDKKDIDELAILLAEIWNPSLDGEVALQAGKVDLAHFAISATYWKIAELNGEVVGVAAVRVGQPSLESVEFWENLSNQSFAKLHELDSKAAQTLKDYYEFERNAHTQMMENCECDTTYELALFAVSSKSRGHGVGSELLRQCVLRLKEAGAKSYFLYTDTNCNWQYYENRGMKRCARYVSTEEETEKTDVEELYAYSTSI